MSVLCLIMAYRYTLDSVLRIKVKGIGTSLALSLLQHNSKRHSRYFTLTKKSPGAVARSEASSLGMQAAPSSIPTSDTFCRGDLVMKIFLRPFSLFR